MKIVTCPACAKKLRMPEDLFDKDVKCPNCGATFDSRVAEPSSSLEPTSTTLPRESDPGRGAEQPILEPEPLPDRTSSGSSFIPCPHCGERVSQHAQVCQHCGEEVGSATQIPGPVRQR